MAGHLSEYMCIIGLSWPELSVSSEPAVLLSIVPFCSCCCGQALIRYCPSLDDPLPLFLAKAYATNHPAMHLNTNTTTKFVEGTVQGAQWYTLLGGMQVWCCIVGGR